jgi:hypothetical protein
VSPTTSTPPADCPRCQEEGHEYYRYLGTWYEFDVERAKEMVRDGRAPAEVEPESVRESVENSRITDEHIDHVDPSIPGLIAHVWYTDEDGTVHGHILIDGNHRAARCLRDGRAFFAYVLTEEESRAILWRSPNERAACGLAGGTAR